MRPHLRHTPLGWVVVYLSSDTGLVTVSPPWDITVAMRRAQRVASRQGRAT